MGGATQSMTRKITLKQNMKMKLLSAFVILLLAAISARSEISIIPQPQKLEVKEGVFALSKSARIHADKSGTGAAELLAARLRAATGFAFKLDAKADAKSGIVLRLAKAGEDISVGPEGYELNVTKDQVVIVATTDAGLFYGTQTLLQLLPPEIFSAKKVSGVKWEIPCVKITDQPRFKWRGMMLDVARHFFTKQEVKALLDTLALQKMNTFHWHLVDDQGWRIEIKKYPRLTQVGAWRSGVGFEMLPDSTTAYGPDGRYGGFYTQDDIREIVTYAAARHITVVPEIEMPGHSMAALASYPEVGTGDGPFTVPMMPGVKHGIYSPAKPESFEFLQNVLTEVFALFPGKYVHIGGDEVPKEPWKDDPACQELMKREGLKSEEELQSWFIRRMETFVNTHGKTLIGWSEILQGGLAPNAVVMDWIGGGKEAASAGHDVVMTPTTHCYFDFYQSTDQSTEPKAMAYGGALTLQKVYSLEPVPDGLAPGLQHHILGAQGNVWTEFMPNFRHLGYMTFPRMTAVAEVTWSAKEQRNFDDFNRRLKMNERRLDHLGVHYRNSGLGDGSQTAEKKTGN